MNIVESMSNNVLVVSVQDDRIDAGVAPELRDTLAKIIARGNARLVLDLSRVSFIDSSGLGAVVSSLKTAGRAGSIAISGARSNVVTLFKLTRMDKVFRMFPTTDEAVTSLAA